MDMTIDRSPVPPCTDAGKLEVALSVAFTLLPEFTLSALAGFIDTLRLSSDNMFGDSQKYCSWTILGPDRSPVRSSCGVEVIPWETFRDPKAFDCIVVIGGQVRGHGRINPATLEYLKEADRRNRVLVGICTGSFALAYAGLMKDCTACVHWFHLPHYLSEFPGHKADSTSIFRIDDNRITCAGGGVSGDLAVYVIAKFCGSAIAQRGISGMLMESPRDLQSVQPHFEAMWFANVKNRHVRRALLLMSQHIRDPIPTKSLASQLGVSYSTINRLFHEEIGVGCGYFYRVFRTAHGFWETIHSSKNITDIAFDFGFSDASHFIRVFRECYESSPAAVRALQQDQLDKLLNELEQKHSFIISAILRGELFFSNDESDEVFLRSGVSMLASRPPQSGYQPRSDGAV